MQIVRIIALGSAIYLAIFVIVMIDPILDKFGHDYAILALVLILAAIPVFVNFYALNVLVADFVIVSSVEMMRDTKTIQIVKRTMVTKKAMIALKLLNSMRTWCSSVVFEREAREFHSFHTFMRSSIERFYFF